MATKLAPKEPKVAEVDVVDVDIQAEEIDEIALKIGALVIHIPAKVEDWPAVALQHAANGEIYPAITGAMRPGEVRAFDRLRLTTDQILAVWQAFSKKAGLGSAGE